MLDDMVERKAKRQKVGDEANEAAVESVLAKVQSKEVSESILASRLTNHDCQPHVSRCSPLLMLAFFFSFEISRGVWHLAERSRYDVCCMLSCSTLPSV